MQTLPGPQPADPPNPGAPEQTSSPAAMAVLDLLTSPVLQVDAQGCVIGLNASAQALLGLHASSRPTLTSLGLDHRAGSAAGATTFDAACLRARGDTIFCRVAAGAQSRGLRLLTLTPIDDLRQASVRAQHLGELLEMVQDFGRLGVWERDVGTLAGRWDQHIYRFWGLDPGGATPGYDEAAQAILPEDRAALDEAFRGSLQEAGSYAHRYRVRRPDGTVRQLHSQWVVQNGPDGRPARVLGIMMDDTEAWALAQKHDSVQAQLRAAVDLGHTATWRYDLQTGRIQHSPIFYEVLGLAPRPSGMPIEELRSLIHPDDLPGVLASAQQALATDQPADVEARYRRADGQWRTLLTRRVVQRDASGTPIALAGVGLDVTEPRDESRRARDMVRRFDLVTRTAGIGYWSLEHGSQQTRWSDQMFTLHGLPPSGTVPRVHEWLARFVHPEDRAPVGQALHGWLRSGRPLLELDFRVVRGDGVVVEVISHSRVEQAGTAPLLFGIFVDVTERRAAELALRQAGVRASLVAQGVGLGTWEQDMLTGVTQWDDQMWRVRGLEPQPGNLAPDDRLALVHPEDQEVAQRMLDRCNATALPVDYEFRVRWPDGDWHWLASRSVAVRDADGRPVRRIGVNWDISEARSAVIAREEKNAAQREVQAKSRFLARMSHELRTPLNAVLGFTQLLMSEGDRGGVAARERRLAHIRSAGEHLLSLIDDVLDLSRLEGGELSVAMAPTALRPLVDDLLALLEPQLRAKGVRVVAGALDVEPLADATRLRQVLLNLLTNAIKYNCNGGSIMVDAEARDGVVVVRVVDTGQGMTGEQQRHLFEPFNRLGAERSGIEGTGIGLAIVKALVERMGGTVEVLSSPGLGSTFVLRLNDGRHAAPPAVDLAHPHAMALAATLGRAGVGGTVLYIEDNPVNAMIVSELLARRSDLALHTATDGISGLALAAQVRPDLILLDMQLPDIDGHEVFARLQAAPPTAHIPCIAVSANAMPADIDRALRVGFSDYWTKPLDFRAFMASIDALFGPGPEERV